jgi:hypothetical protein
LADADRQEIEVVDQPRLDLINAIHILGIVQTLFVIVNSDWPLLPTSNAPY